MSEGVWIAIIGFLGIVVGAIVSEARHWRKDRAILRREARQKERLDELLTESEHKFRKLSTLMHAIAADENTTKRLLIDIGARPSLDGQPLWTMELKNQE